MTTFTLRAPVALTGRLGSAEMRCWLEEFLRQPHTLPRDPGSGHGRISLTLSDSTVKAIAAYSRCSVSSALRRIAAERVGAPAASPSQVPQVKVAHTYPGSTTISEPSARHKTAAPHEMEGLQGSPDGGAIVGVLIQFLLWVLVMGACFFLSSRKKKGAKGA